MDLECVLLVVPSAATYRSLVRDRQHAPQTLGARSRGPRWTDVSPSRPRSLPPVSLHPLLTSPNQDAELHGPVMRGLQASQANVGTYDSR